jgi:hypothetical protein
MDNEIYKLVRTGHTENPETGERIQLTNEEMATVKWQAASERFAKKKHLLKDRVIIRHKIKVTRYGCNVFDVVDSKRASELCDKAPKEWARYNLKPAAPPALEQTETRTRKKQVDADV